ncbi:MAG TPA: glycosyltransferase family 1 protein [Bryobacteraceae bacterium]|nr:glycosyltransferase family 1 protein [Bryobacteraceae bacterium]
MRFSVDAHAIGQHLTGNEVYIRNLLKCFAGLDHHSEFIAYHSTDNDTAADAIPARFRQRRVSRNSFLRLGYELSRKVREDRPDLLHVQYTAPLACPVPVVVSVHDVSFIEHPEYFAWPRMMQLRCTVKRTVKAAAKVITPSEFSRQSIARAYRLDDSKIVVVPIAVSSAFHPVSREMAADQVKLRFGISGPYVVTVGDLQPRKNQIGLIRAFENLIRNEPQLPHQLVIVGQKTWFSDRIVDAAKASTVTDRIRFTDFVTDAELLQLYNAADLFVFPSLYEGFGLPILEAMACGRAVACSNTSAMPEVANAAALLFDPESVDEMTRAIRDILLDPELRARMERLGQQRASLFTWERTASKTLEIYHEVAGRKAALAPAEVKPVSVRSS